MQKINWDLNAKVKMVSEKKAITMALSVPCSLIHFNGLFRQPSSGIFQFKLHIKSTVFCNILILSSKNILVGYTFQKKTLLNNLTGK